MCLLNLLPTWQCFGLTVCTVLRQSRGPTVVCQRAQCLPWQLRVEGRCLRQHWKLRGQHRQEDAIPLGGGAHPEGRPGLPCSRLRQVMKQQGWDNDAEAPGPAGTLSHLYLPQPPGLGRAVQAWTSCLEALGRRCRGPLRSLTCRDSSPLPMWRPHGPSWEAPSAQERSLGQDNTVVAPRP